MRGTADEAFEVVAACCKHLDGKTPFVQGAALADLLAMYLAGHFVDGDAHATKAVREQTLAMLIETVWKLVPINYAQMIEPKLKKRQ
jgi:hypothetical protein